MAVQLAPLAPHLAEELWERLGGAGSVHSHAWPAYDERMLRDETITLVVQVNGKVRDKIEGVPADITAEQARELALGRAKVQANLDGGRLLDVRYVPGRLINLVIGR
jgi:leucyl-tRNA synthetase